MMQNLINKGFFALIILTILTLVALYHGFSIIPSPFAQQGIQADQQRVVDLGEIVSSMNSYFQNNGALPKSLNKLTGNTDNPSAPLEITDPITKKPYGYKIVDSSAGYYDLCAIFYKKVEATTDNTDTNFFSDSLYSTYEAQFSHPAGYYCYNESTNQNEPTINPYPSVSPLPSIANQNVASTSSIPAEQPTMTPWNADDKRSADVSVILNAIYQYIADNAGALPTDLVGLPPNNPLDINSENFVALCNELVPKYMHAFPIDPVFNTVSGVTKCSSTWNTGYFVSRDAKNHITIQAPFTQAGAINLTHD